MASHLYKNRVPTPLDGCVILSSVYILENGVGFFMWVYSLPHLECIRIADGRPLRRQLSIPQHWEECIVSSTLTLCSFQIHHPSKNGYIHRHVCLCACLANHYTFLMTAAFLGRSQRLRRTVL